MEAQTTLRNLPIGIQNFESLRTDGYIYVDKTELIYRLVTTGRYYFLSNPRRFGKLSVFSGLNNLEDITMEPEYSDVCGITEKEMLSNFDSATRNIDKVIVG